MMILTTSRDTSMKIFAITSQNSVANQIEFDRSEGVIVELVEMDSTTLASRSTRSR